LDAGATSYDAVVELMPNRRTDFGIRSLLLLARDGGTAKASVIASELGISEGVTRQVLQALCRAGLVASRSSGSGGYWLARPPERISLLDIVQAMEGTITTTECALRDGPCHWEKVCALHRVWTAAQEAFCVALAAATLDQVTADDAALAAGTMSVPGDSHRRRHGRS
jgi:Rrf2 family protein